MTRKLKIGDVVGPGPNYVDQDDAWIVDRVAFDGGMLATSITTGMTIKVEKHHRVLRGAKRHKQLVRLLEKTRSAYHRAMAGLEAYYRDKPR